MFLRSIIFCFTITVAPLLNAQSKKQASVDTIIPQRLEIYDTIWGEVVHDPYRWMEERENDSLKNGLITKTMSLKI